MGEPRSPEELLDELASRPPPEPPPGPEPCFDCECCALWAISLQALRDSIVRHVAGELRVSPCSPECLVCAQIGWQGQQ